MSSSSQTTSAPIIMSHWLLSSSWCSLGAGGGCWCGGGDGGCCCWFCGGGDCVVCACICGCADGALVGYR